MSHRRYSHCPLLPPQLKGHGMTPKCQHDAQSYSLRLRSVDPLHLLSVRVMTKMWSGLNITAAISFWQAILHASLDRAALSVEKFSRWLRAICTILLSRNRPTDRTKAIGYVEQAVEVLLEHGRIGDPQVRDYVGPVERFGLHADPEFTLRLTVISHGRTALAHGDGLQHRYRVLAVRHILCFLRGSMLH